MPYLKRINSLPLINQVSYKYTQVSDIGPSWSSCFLFYALTAVKIMNEDKNFTLLLFIKSHSRACAYKPRVHAKPSLCSS